MDQDDILELLEGGLTSGRSCWAHLGQYGAGETVNVTEGSTSHQFRKGPDTVWRYVFVVTYGNASGATGFDVVSDGGLHRWLDAIVEGQV